MSKRPNDTDTPVSPQQPGRSPLLRRLRRLAIGLGAVLWLLLLCAWSTGVTPKRWSSWLDDLQAPSKASSGKGNKFGRRATGTRGLAYLGEGRADLGKYKISLFDPLTGTVSRAEFKLQGTTSCEDESSFREFIDAHNRFLREQVMVTIRNSRVSDLDDPKLRLLEKKLMARVNRALGQRFLRTVDFKDFRLFQSNRQVQIGKNGQADEEAEIMLGGN